MQHGAPHSPFSPLPDCNGNRKRVHKAAMKLLIPIALGIAALILPASCTTTPGASHPAMRERAAAIAAEPRGAHFIGRRYHVEGTRFWGYLRQPGESWERARLVVMNPGVTRPPDMLPENPAPGQRGHGFDDNYEYVITGSFTGRRIYDPNSNLFLPEFLPSSFRLTNPSPGFLFHPDEIREPNAVSLVPSRGIPR